MDEDAFSLLLKAMSLLPSEWDGLAHAGCDGQCLTLLSPIPCPVITSQSRKKSKEELSSREIHGPVLLPWVMRNIASSFRSYPKFRCQLVNGKIKEYKGIGKNVCTLLICVCSFKYVTIFLYHSNSFLPGPIIVEIFLFLLTDVEQIFIRETHLLFISFEIKSCLGSEFDQIFSAVS